MIAVYALLAVLLLCLNAFFVLAEFAAVRLRRSRSRSLAETGGRSGRLVEHVQTHLDEYLSVCQLGITFASIGLGFVGEPIISAFVRQTSGLGTAAAGTIAIGAGYLLISVLHVVLGELLPKSIAIRKAEGSALWTAPLLAFFRVVFYVPLMILNGATMALLRLAGIPRNVHEASHTEEELRDLLGESSRSGIVPFERLLLIENVFDLSGMKVRDVMRRREDTKVLHAGIPWNENLALLRSTKFSRFPLVEIDRDQPVGVIHVKDVLYASLDGTAVPDLSRLARPFVTALEEAPLEGLLGDLRRKRTHLAIVRDAGGRWTGIVSLEDVLEEIVGSIADEFEAEAQVFPSDALAAARITLDLDASSMEEAVGRIFGGTADADLPLPRTALVRAVLERERAMSTYLGEGIAVPHARIEGLTQPLIFFARSESGVPVGRESDRARFIFVVLTPAGAPRIQSRLIARLLAMMRAESLAERLKTASTPEAVLEAVHAAEAVAV